MLKFQQPVVVTNDGGKYITKVETGRVHYMVMNRGRKADRTRELLRISFFWHRWEPALQ